VAVSLALCVGASLLCVGVITLIFALAANFSADPTGKIGIFSLVSLLISAVLSGLITALTNKERGGGFFALIALGTVAVMMVACLIMTGGKISASAFMNYGCYLGAYALSALLGKKRKARPRRRFK
jgi:O-antigen/teichoic acid export membrane protein